MARNYSFLELKQIDWDGLTGRYRERALAADSPANFIRVIGEMLAGLKDVHTWIDFEGNRTPGFRSVSRPNYDMSVEIGKLPDAPGLVIDLRSNVGGAEGAAAAIAGMFIDQEVVYARQKFRNGDQMMMKAIPNCTLVGQPTRGASGNPQPVQLPNGVDVWYSRWVSMLPDGTPIEGTGVPPDHTVDHVAGKDPTWSKALEILREKTNGL